MPRCLPASWWPRRLRTTPLSTSAHHNHDGASRKELIPGEISDHSFRFFSVTPSSLFPPLTHIPSSFFSAHASFAFFWFPGHIRICGRILLLGFWFVIWFVVSFSFFYPFCYNFFGSFAGRGRCHVTLLSTNDRPRKD